MPATVHLVLGPVGAGQSEWLLHRYHEVAEQRIGTALWIAPTERSREEVLESLARTAGAVLSPGVMTLPDLAAQLAGPQPQSRVLPAPHQRMLLRELLAELRRKKLIPYFAPLIDHRGVVDSIFSFISELKGRGITPAQFEECATRLSDLRGQGLRPKDAEIGLIFARYHLMIAQQRWSDRESQYAIAIERLRTKKSAVQARAVFVDGFHAFTPPQIQLLRELTSHVAELGISLPYDGHDLQRKELDTPSNATLVDLEYMLPNSVRVELPAAADTRRPAGLSKLATDLFRDKTSTSDDATGLALIEAPGLLGEVRMVARAIKQRLLDGVDPSAIMVSARNLNAHAALLPEVFAEYGIPLDIEATEPLSRQPIVAALLSATELLDDNWPFAATTALLRSTFFRPDWDEAAGDAAADAEITLRLIGEPRGRDAYLTAARKCAEAPEVPLEDEEAGGSALRRKHGLAKSSLALLERFFQAWDDAPPTATFADHTAWLHLFAERMGFTKDEGDPNLDRLWHELDRWSARQVQQHGKSPSISRSEFLSSVESLAGSVGMPIVQRLPGQVRALSAELAIGLKYDHLFVMGLGEGSFPDLGGSGLLYDEAERRAFCEAGLDLGLIEDRLAREMLLFHRLLNGAAKSITLSFAAVNEKGQDQLPGTFLQNVQSLFADSAIPVNRRRLLVEGIESQTTYSAAEFRVRLAKTGQLHSAAISEELISHLNEAKGIAQSRFDSPRFGKYDGWMTDPAICDEIGRRFAPTKAWSVSSLDEYIACPFKFFMGRVLGFQRIEDPEEDIEQTRRGAAYHRALARLHRRPAQQLRDVTKALANEIDVAVAEEIARAGSAASKVLWELEAVRLKRSAARYAEQWTKFRDSWAKAELELMPASVEASFNSKDKKGVLAIGEGESQVRLHGRIDRIDMATLPDDSQGFVVIDYKTGGAPSLKAAAQLENLQLAVYSMAAARDLGGDARPLGFVYWKLSDNGASTYPRGKGGWLDSPEEWNNIQSQLEQWLVTLVSRIRSGEFPLSPRDRKKSCEHCEFHRSCRISQSRADQKTWSLPLPIAEGAEA